MKSSTDLETPASVLGKVSMTFIRRADEQSSPASRWTGGLRADALHVVLAVFEVAEALSRRVKRIEVAEALSRRVKRI